MSGNIVKMALFGLCLCGLWLTVIGTDWEDATADSGSFLTGSNICNRTVTIQGYVTKLVSYPCTTWTWCRCNDNTRKKRHAGWYRRNRIQRDCKCYQHKTCYRHITQCVPRTVTRKFCCPGYEQTYQATCTRSNPCMVNNGGCDQICHHGNQGEHVCSCFNGYKLDQTTKQCVDINECTTNNGGCSQICHNTQGGFYCSCRNGYYESSLTHCTEINECIYGNGGCEQVCQNTPGSYYCTCLNGYTLYQSNICRDINECLVNNGGCSNFCENYHGGYVCECPVGYTLQADGKTCIRQNPGINSTTFEVASSSTRAPTTSSWPRETTTSSFTTLATETTTNTSILNNNGFKVGMQTDNQMRRTPVFVFPLIGTLLFLIIISVVIIIVVCILRRCICYKNTEAVTIDGPHLYEIPIKVGVKEHEYARPSTIASLKGQYMVPNGGVGYINPSYSSPIYDMPKVYDNVGHVYENGDFIDPAEYEKVGNISTNNGENTNANGNNGSNA